VLLFHRSPVRAGGAQFRYCGSEITHEITLKGYLMGAKSPKVSNLTFLPCHPLNNGAIPIVVVG
jgi:hypothetical protein